MRVDDARTFEDNAAACIKAIYPKFDWYVGIVDHGRMALVACKVPEWKDRRVKGRQNGGPPELFMDMAAALVDELEPRLREELTNAKA